MAELSTVARPYAQALFELACESKLNLNAWGKQMAQMAQIAANPDVRALMLDPRFDAHQRVQIFFDLLPDRAISLLDNFITLLVQNHRLVLLPEIADQFQRLKDRHEAVTQAHITSAFALNAKQLKALVATLELKFGMKLKAQVSVDSSLIGGVRVAVNDQVVDTSVKAQLTRMRDVLTA